MTKITEPVNLLETADMEEISYIEIKQLITDKMPIKVALLLDILIYTFSLNYHRKTRL